MSASDQHGPHPPFKVASLGNKNQNNNTTMSIVTPTDEELISALKQLRADHPALGRDNVLKELRPKNG
jgi:hypothetical protein